MIPALSFESMEEEVKNSFESIPNTIVGIMYARYDIELVKKNDRNVLSILEYRFK